MYLFDVFYDGNAARGCLDSLLSKHHMELNWGESHIAGGINSYLEIKGPGVFHLSEFPGNCSSLVVSGIEGKWGSRLSLILDFCTDMCKDFGYALLFASGVEESHKNFLVERGFEIIMDNIVNPHSGNENYFAVLTIQKD